MASSPSAGASRASAISWRSGGAPASRGPCAAGRLSRPCEAKRVAAPIGWLTRSRLTAVQREQQRASGARADFSHVRLLRDHPDLELSGRLRPNVLIDALVAIFHEVELVDHVDLREVDHPAAVAVGPN